MHLPAKLSYKGMTGSAASLGSPSACNILAAPRCHRPARTLCRWGMRVAQTVACAQISCRCPSSAASLVFDLRLRTRPLCRARQQARGEAAHPQGQPPAHDSSLLPKAIVTAAALTASLALPGPALAEAAQAAAAYVAPHYHKIDDHTMSLACVSLGAACAVLTFASTARFLMSL